MNEFRSTSHPKVGMIAGNNFKHKDLKYAEIEGLAIFEAAIVLGTVA